MYYTVCEVAKRLKLSPHTFVFMARKVYWILLSETRTAIVFLRSRILNDYLSSPL